MDPLRRPVSRLLVLLVLLLYFASSVSHDPTPPVRVSRNSPVQSREKVAASSQMVQRSLALIGSVMGNPDSKQVSALMKSLQNMASLAPVIGGLVSSFLGVALASIPEENHLKELRDGFELLNRKLDSLSIQTSNLVLDAEWLNYASVYSRDEAAILNAWKRLDELWKGSELSQSREDKVRLAQVFTAYYQNSGAADGVLNLYRCLTVRGTSLSVNINQMLRDKSRCNVNQVLRYNLHLSGLLWRGMLLQQVYWRLTGSSSPAREAQHIQMFQEVLKVQQSAVDFCLDNYQQYLKEDVVEITRKLSPEKPKDIAVQVKAHLDRKFSWSSWVVYVLRSHWESVHSFPSMLTIPVDEFHPGIGKLTVAVGATQKEDGEQDTAIRRELHSCYERSTKPPPRKDPQILDTTACEDVARAIPHCSRPVDGVPVRERVKVMVFGSAYQRKRSEVAEAPEALELLDCMMEHIPGKVSVHLSRNLTVCPEGWCLNAAPCRRLLDSNQQLCDCPRGYYGDRCQHEIKTAPGPDPGYTIPDMTATSARLELMEAKMEEILRYISSRCPSQ